MLYYEKYLKYKNKYILLKNQLDNKNILLKNQLNNKYILLKNQLDNNNTCNKNKECFYTFNKFYKMDNYFHNIYY